MSGWFKWLLVLGVAWGAYQGWLQREFTQPPGILVTDEPQQLPLPEPRKIFQRDDYQIEALAHYRIRGRLLSQQRYRWDASAGVSPLDFGLGWGPMSDSRVLDKMRFWQSGRFLHWRWSGAPPLPFEVLNSHASNTHLIPADTFVLKRLRRVRVGQLVELRGYLVKVSGANGFQWAGSMTRTDIGDGACEIMYVEDVHLI